MPIHSEIDAQIVHSKKELLLKRWLADLSSAGQSGDRRTTALDVEQQAAEFISQLDAGLQSGDVAKPDAAGWGSVRSFLNGFSRERATRGFSAEQTANNP